MKKVIVIMQMVLFIVQSVFSQVENKNKSGIEKDSTVRDMQFSILPFVSINSISANERVDFSLNLLAGYVKEVRSVELGSILNIVRTDAGYCQLSGVGNIVGKTTRGFQGAGVINITRDLDGVQSGGVLNIVHNNAKTCQLAGVGNITVKSFNGLQAAGVLNFAESAKGIQCAGVINLSLKDTALIQAAGVANINGGTIEHIQFAGVYNYAKNMKGVQIAGVYSIAMKSSGPCQVSGVGNLAGDSINGIQVSGVVNLAKEAKGAQIAGVVNYSSKIIGSQIAGTVNYADDVHGLQLSGVLNKASFFKGTQISVVNIADSCNGIPIGVISIVGKGYKKIDISADEILYSNVAFRTGVKQFYNIVMAGIRPGNFDNPLWAFGYGAGTKFEKQTNLSYDLEISAQHICNGNFHNYLSELYKLYFGVDWKINSFFSLCTGITYNLFLSNINSPDYNNTFSKIAPYSFSNNTYHNKLNMKTWLGARIAIRFF